VARQNPNAARERFQRALTLDPSLAEALIALGKLDAASGRHADAIGHLERAVKLRPNSEPALYNLMLAYRNAGRAADARAASDRLQKLQQPPQGEFTEFLKKLGEKTPPQ